jgi:hypothetical protein
MRAVPRLPRAPDIRFRVEPGDIPAEKVARRLHLTPAQFESVRPRLFMRGFPRPDPDTGMYCLEAIDRWQYLRHPSLFPELAAGSEAPTPAAPKVDLVERAREGEERRRQERMAPRGTEKSFGQLAREGEQKRREAREQIRLSRKAARGEAST